MMLRNAKRLFRLYGFRPFAVPCVVFIALAVMVDQLARDCWQQADERDALAARVEKMRTKLARQSDFDRLFAERKADYDRQSARTLVAADPGSAAARLQTTVQAMLTRLNTESIQVSSLSTTPVDDAGVVAVAIQFRGVPQQLVRLADAINGDSLAMRLTEVEARLPNPPAVPARIEVKGRLEGIFVRESPTPGVGKKADAR